jgi:gentisate 1,2-dioxygenase
MNQENYFGWLMSVRDSERKRRQAAKLVIKGADRPWEMNPLGKVRWYMHPAIEDTPTKSHLLYVQEIPAGGRSGKMLVPGGQVIYFWQGSGYTVLDGETFPWREGDVLQLPVRPQGVTFQHFNDNAGVIAKLIVVEANHIGPLGVEKGSRFEVIEEALE